MAFVSIMVLHVFSITTIAQAYPQLIEALNDQTILQRVELQSSTSYENQSSFSSIGQHAAYQGLQAGVGLTLDALTGENISEALENRLKFAAVNTIAGYAANKIGDAYNKTPEGTANPVKLSWAEHKLLHGGLGAAMGAALSRHAGEGALAAGIASMVAESLAECWAPENSNPRYTKDTKEGAETRGQSKEDLYKRYKHAADMAKLATATLAMLYCPEHIDVAVLAATNALENNFLYSLDNLHLNDLNELDEEDPEDLVLLDGAWSEGSEEYFSLLQEEMKQNLNGYKEGDGSITVTVKQVVAILI